jgi:hypothetical protein
MEAPVCHWLYHAGIGAVFYGVLGVIPGGKDKLAAGDGSKALWDTDSLTDAVWAIFASGNWHTDDGI